MRAMLLKLSPFLDALLLPMLVPAAWLLRFVRRAGVDRLPKCRSALVSIGVFPIRDHYYEPQFNYRHLRQPFSRDRSLPGIDWNVPEQLELLAGFSFAGELAGIPVEKSDALDFHLNNPSFSSGDAEYWYQLIRKTKPSRIFEIGSGHSTLMASRAVRRNREDDANYQCRHVCIEPYEMPWLERTGVEVVRQKVEELPAAFFSELAGNDILFIDSSHVIRPQGDVLFEFLELLPTLSQGVIVHVHDIFSPRNYPSQWLEGQVRFWNEQYLLEAFLSHNKTWKIIGALNYLHHNYYDELKSVAPFLSPEREPGSFYMQKIA